MDAGSVRDFYDDLADTFDLIYPDWQGSVERQAQALDRLLRQALGPGPLRLLDCACGIGAQTLGLLERGHWVAACASMAAVTRPEGVVVISVRDYDQLREVRPRSMPPSFTQTADGRAITFQLWHWHTDGEHYDLELFQLIGQGDDWNVRWRVTTYWALARADIGQALVRAGWAELSWHEPHDSGFFQPLVMATRPNNYCRA